MLSILLTLGAWAADVSPEADALDEQFVAAWEAGDYARASELAREALDVRRRDQGPRHEDVAGALANLASSLQVMGQVNAAKPLFEACLDIAIEVHGPHHEDVAASQNNLGMVHYAAGDYAGARPWFQAAIDTWRVALGPDDPAVVTGLNNLGGLNMQLGDLKAAEASFAESLAIQQRVGATDEDLVDTWCHLGSVQRASGRLDAARTHLTRCLEVRTRVHGPRHPAVGTAQLVLGLLFEEEGDLAAARHAYETGLAIREEVFGPDHRSVAEALDNLGTLVEEYGDHEAAIPLLERGVAIKRATLGPRHPSLATSLNNLALAYQNADRNHEARALHAESLAIRREVLGPDNTDVANSLNNLATLDWAQGDFAAARAGYEQSLAIDRAALGSQHPHIGKTLVNLSRLIAESGDPSGAIAPAEESVQIMRGLYGDDSLRVASALHNLARIRLALGEEEVARAHIEEGLRIALANLDLLTALSERESLAWLPRLRPLLDGWLTTHERPDEAREAWSHVLAFKGVVAARVRAARQRARLDPALGAQAERLDAVRRARAQLAFHEGTPDRAALDALVAEQEQLERTLLAEGAASSDVGPDDLCTALPRKTAVIDLLRYGHRARPAYLAFVMSSRDCVVHRVDLGAAEPLEQAAAAWHEVLRDPDAAPTRVQRRGEELSALLYTPLVAVADADTHWLVVPDGPLATLPFGALPVDGGFAVEARQITYLDRANDAQLPPPSEATGAVVVGGVSYTAEQARGTARTRMAPCNGGGYTDLPGTAAEAATIQHQWSPRRGELQVLSGEQATESAVGSALSHRALAHIATHGFFATGSCRSALDGAGHDPMLLSGLVLAGANQPPDPGAVGDGILTAAEVATLDLDQTGTVVLSACETGLGEVRSGQGVLGLRRGFAIAGARTLVMSLWSVDDSETATLMDGFYRHHLRKGRPAAEALRRAQLDLLARQRQDGVPRPYAWGSFIASGAWE